MVSVGSSSQAEMGRTNVRNSSGIPYVLTNNGGNVQLWKGNSATPTSFSEVDSTNNPNDANFKGGAIAIDSGNTMHIVYFDDDTAMGAGGGLKYVTVSSDTWGTPATAVAIDKGLSTNGQSQLCDISVDSNDVPHIVFTDRTTNMGTDYPTIYYTNRVGGSWNTAVELRGATATEQCFTCAIMVNQNNYPQVVLGGNGGSFIRAYRGTANNATTFTDSGSFDSGSHTCLYWIMMDTNNRTYVTYLDHAAVPALSYNNSADSWSTWTTSTSSGSSTSANNSCGSVDGTDVYIFYEDSNHDIVYDKYTGSWAGATSLQTGTYDRPRSKWAYWVDFDSDGHDVGEHQTTNARDEIDYTWNAVNWDTLAMAAPPAPGTSINIGDSWKAVTITSMQINIGDVWKSVSGVQINIGDAWKTVS